MMKFAQMLRRMRSEEKGFTLVELMVVVVIIGVLAAVAIPKFSGIIDNSKEKADIASGKTVKDAVDRFYTDRGAYPASLADLTGATPSPYLNSIPKVAQGSGAAAATSVFIINTDGSVLVKKVNGATVQTNDIWNSNS